MNNFSWKPWRLLLALLCAFTVQGTAHDLISINPLREYNNEYKAVGDFKTSRFSTSDSTSVSAPETVPAFMPVSMPNSVPVSMPVTTTTFPPSPLTPPVVIRFNYTGGVQSYTVPAGVTNLKVTLFGAQGGASFSDGGYGAMISSIISVEPEQQLFIFVGGMGTATAGGFNGGGAPDMAGSTQYTRGGGGATDIRMHEQSLFNRVLVAGGGGAGGFCGAGPGGGGGYLAGMDGTVCIQGYPSGKGGTQVGGGAYGDGENTCTTASNGMLGQGGHACHSVNYSVGNYGGGGGGGYFGGGGSFAAGAGGGSSYSAYPVVANQTAVNKGNGYALIEYLGEAPPTLFTTAAPSLEPTAVPSLKPSPVPSYTRTRTPTRAGHQVYVSGNQIINGVSWNEFEAEPAAVPAWIESVSRVCAGSRAALVRAVILSKNDAYVNERLLSEGFGVQITFNITFTQEDFAPYKPANVDNTVALLTTNFVANTANGTFLTVLQSELNDRDAARNFVSAVSPAVPLFQLDEYVARTGLDPSAIPSALPSRTPTRSPTLNDRAPLITAIATNVSASTIVLDVTFNPMAVYPGTLYCAAFPGSTQKLSSINQVTTAGFRSGYVIGATTARVTVTGLSALTAYATYCYLETSRGVGNSLLEVQETRRVSTTTCCKPLSFKNSPASVYGNPSRYSVSQSAQYVFTYTLGSAPSEGLTVSPEFRSSEGQLMSAIVITTSPASATFTSQPTTLSSSFVIVTGAGFVTDNFVLTLKLTGSSVAQYRGVSTNVRVLSANAPPSPPMLQTALFSTDGSIITVTFDSATNQAATTVTGCSTFFVFDGSSKASCRWISNAQVRITYAAFDSTVTYAEPQDTFGLRSGVIKANCPSGAVCTDYIASAAQNVTLAAPSNALTPSVLVAVPANVASCANITIDASQSTGHGGRPWRTVVWSVHASVNGVDTSALQAKLSSLGTKIAQFITLPAALYAEPDVSYTLTLSVTNFLGVSSSASASFTLSGNPNLPTVQVLGGTSFTITPSSTLTVYSSSTKAACAEKQMTFSTRWQVYTADMVLVSSAVTTSRDPSILMLAPLTLAADTRYRALVTTTASASSINPAVSATAEAIITVQSGAVVVLVSGGESRLVPATEVVSIDASNSYDENLGSAAPSVGLTFAWTCSYLTASQFGTSCDNVFVSGSSSQSSVSVRGLVLDSTQIYSFTVQVSSTDGRTASKSVTLQVQPPESSTNLAIGSLPRKVNANTRLAVTVQLVAGYALTGLWSASIDGSPVSLTAETPLTESFTAQDVQSPGIAFPLLVSNNAHSTGSVVTFRFTATRTGTSFASAYASFAEASVVINAPPSSGVFTVTPSAGSALSTVFRFLASGYTDDVSDLPLSYMFSYVVNSESSALVVQPLSGVNSASALLPAGGESLNYIIDSLTTVYDVFGASTTATASVRVTSVSSASAINAYLNESLEAFATTGDTSFAFNLVNNVATTFSTVNCSIATAAFCASKNRHPCATEPNTCSSCLDGYSGVSGNSNAKCLINAENRRLSERTLYGTACATNDDCLLGNCTSSICVVPPLLCPSSVIGSTCSANGQCAYTDTTGKALISCTVLDTQCFADCACSAGWGGYDCSLTSEELRVRDNSRRSLCETILTVSGQSNPSTVLLDNLVGSLSVLFQPAEVVSNATLSTCTEALTTIASLAEEGYFINSAENTIPNLLDLTGRFARAGNASLAHNSSALNDALTRISTGVLLSMVNGQSDTSVASANIKFKASKSLVRQFSGLVSPSSSQEEEYGVASKASVELTGDGAATACDAGKGYVDVSLTQWGTVPFDGASQLIAPLIQFKSKVPTPDNSRRELAFNEINALAAAPIPSYYVVFQFNQPQNLLPKPEENVTFPECTVYDQPSGKYVSCNGCTVSSYTNTNVTYACSDITQLCASDTDTTARRLEDSLDLSRRLVNFDDYVDDGSSFGSQTSVTTIQYSALISTFTSVLSVNVFALNFAAAKVTLSVVLVLVGVIIFGFVYFRAWDVRDHNKFLYKFKEPPHLRVKKKYQAKQLSWKDSAQNLVSTMGNGSPSSQGKSNDRDSFDFGAELGVEYTQVYPEDAEEVDQDHGLSATQASPPGNALTLAPVSGSATDKSDGSAFTPASRPDPFEKSDTMKNCAFNPTAKSFNVQEDETLVRSAVENYIRNVIPIKNLAGAPTTTLSTMLGLIAQHPLSNLFFSPSLQVTRVQRWMMVCLDIMCGLFVDTLFFSTFYPNAGECEDFITMVDCETPQNSALNTNLCVWKEDLTTLNGGNCDAVPPPSDIMFVMVLVMITLVVTVPIVFLFDFIMTQYCSKRPDFALWGYNTEAVLGASTQKLGEFNTEKHAAPIVSLRRQIKRVRKFDGAALRFHSALYLSETQEVATEESSPSDAENEEARAVYDEFIGVKEEVDQILQEAITYLTVTLRNQNVPWKTSAASGHTAATAVLLNHDKIKAIEDLLGVFADGTPARLTLLERVMYGTAKGKLRAKILSARRKAAQIREMMENLGETELLSKDQALTQFFVLEQFSIFKQYALRSQLFSFAVTTALPVDPGVWVASWAFLIGGLVFFVYWTLAWGVSTSDVTLRAWGINFAIATAQEVFVVQVFRMYIVYMISNIFVKPQLTAIYRTLQRLSIEYVQDELPDAFGVIKVVQHVSPACRVASMKVSDNLAAGQILRHIDDHDIRNFRHASELGLPILFLSVVAIPVIIGLVSDAAGDIALDTVLPSVFSMLVVGHYMLYQISPVAVILPYSCLLVVLLTQSYVVSKVEKRLLKIRQRRATQQGSNKLGNWHVRSGQALDRDQSYLASVMRYFRSLCQRYVTFAVDALAVMVHYVTHGAELKALFLQALFPVPRSQVQTAQWRWLNAPQYLQGEVIDNSVADTMEKTAAMALTSLVIPVRVQAMCVGVTAPWVREEVILHRKTCGDGLLKRLCPDSVQLEPAALAEGQNNATFGSVVHEGTHEHAHVNGQEGLKFKEKYGFCATATDAIGKVIASYQKQKMAGSLYFVSLLDETLLLGADTPTQLLQYEGHVHVRDLACMLEEILYFYRPHRRALTETELLRILCAYDTWVSQEAVPVDPDVLKAVTFLLIRPVAETKETQSAKHAEEERVKNSIHRGYFQQHKLVCIMHFGRVAKELNATLTTDQQATDPALTQSTPSHTPDARYTSRWSEIRRLLDSEQEKLLSVENSLMGAALRSLHGQQKLRIAARLESKKYRHEVEPEKVFIAHAAVPFHLLVRFLLSLLQDVTREDLPGATEPALSPIESALVAGDTFARGEPLYIMETKIDNKEAGVPHSMVKEENEVTL